MRRFSYRTILFFNHEKSNFSHRIFPPTRCNKMCNDVCSAREILESKMVEIERSFLGEGEQQISCQALRTSDVVVDTNRRSGRATYMMTFRDLDHVNFRPLRWPRRRLGSTMDWRDRFHGEEHHKQCLEIRSYPEFYRTATTVTGKNMDSAGSEAFMRLSGKSPPPPCCRSRSDLALLLPRYIRRQREERED